MSAARITLPLYRHLDRIMAGWHRLTDGVLDGYRPERHYMRGPGPKWHAKHGAAGAIL